MTQNPPTLIDTHAHLDDDRFDAIRDDVVARSLDAGVAKTIVIGTSATASAKCVRLASEYDSLYAAVGIQPNHTHQAVERDWERIVALTREPKVVAIGETGLDRYWDDAPFDLQQDYFDRHLRLSQETGLPFVVHMRECGDDVLAMLNDAHARGPLRGVMHSFTGDERLAAECLALDMYISFAGMLTYKKSDDLRAVAKTVPMNRLLIETDSPYLSPEPKRGHRPNEPSLVVHTAACLAATREMKMAELAAQTTANAERLFFGGE